MWHAGAKRKVFGVHASDSDSMSDVEVRRKKTRGTDSGDDSDPSVKSKEFVRPWQFACSHFVEHAWRSTSHHLV